MIFPIAIHFSCPHAGRAGTAESRGVWRAEHGRWILEDFSTNSSFTTTSLHDFVRHFSKIPFSHLKVHLRMFFIGSYYEDVTK